MSSADRRLITDHRTHAVYLVENGKRRWIPDLWTMQTLGLSPDQIEILPDEDVHSMDEDTPVASEVPPPALEEGQLVESEGKKVYIFQNGALEVVADPRELQAQEGFNPKTDVVYLPAALIRRLRPAYPEREKS